MGKRSNAFFNRLSQQTQAAQEAQERTAQIADALSEAPQVTSPVEQLQDAVPQAAPVIQRTGVTDVGPGLAPENLSPEELTPLTEVQPSEETISEVQRAQIPKVNNIGIEPRVLGSLSPEESEAALTEQLMDERVMRAGALTDEYLNSFYEEVDAEAISSFNAEDNDDGMLLLRDIMEAGANSVRTEAGTLNLFGKKIDLSSVPPQEVAGDPDGVIRRYSDMFNGIVKSQRKLNMLEYPANPNSEIKKEFGRAASLAVILEVGNRLQAQNSEIDDSENDRRFDDALDRTNIGKAIGQRVIRLLKPSANEDPQAMVTGETSDFGYDYGNITEEEQSVLGQTIIQGFANSPQFNWLQPYLIKSDGKMKNTFRTTRSGEEQIAKIRRSARRSLGLADKDRPVSLVPTKGGRMRGEAAYTQKKITAQVKKNYLSDSAKDAINALGSVAHTTSPHKVLLAQGMLNSTIENKTGVFAKFAKQDKGYNDKKFNEFMREYTAKARADSTFTPQSLGYMSFEEAAVDGVNRITRNHLFERQETVLDGVARMGNSFYYGYTAINNSERLMISQTELNYQADKMARFIVDGAIPARFKKGSNNRTEQNFFKILARSLVPGADKMSASNQILAFELRREEFTKWGKQLLNYTRQNENRLQTAKQDNLKGLPPLNLSEDLESYLLNDMGKDEFYFAMDALHELARYDLIDNNAEFATRVKGEIDGNSNGAVIQGMQMGVRDILSKGGVLYQDNADLEDIRYHVFDQIHSHPEFLKDMAIKPVFDKIKKLGKIKELMKTPIMTSIYGKDPAFHRDTAKKFYDDNTNLFEGIEMHPDQNKNREMIITQLTDSIRFGLEQGLSGALEHAQMAKRIGRIFNIANEIAEVEGANGFMVQAGGFEFKPFSQTVSQFGPGALEGSGRETLITTYQRNPSALAEAKGKKIAAGEKNNPDMGSKLRNQLAVNATQNIDASIAQATVTKVIGNQPGSNVMQVYDAFMGDAYSFGNLIETSNEMFYDINEKYNMLEMERKALRQLKDIVKRKVNEKKASGQMFNIGIEGDYRGMGNLIEKAVGRGSIIMRDIPDGSAKRHALSNLKGDRTTGVGFANFAGTPGLPGQKDNSQRWFPKEKEVLISPEKFLQLFNSALTMLNVEPDLDKMIKEVNARRKELLKEIRRSGIRQYS